MDILDAAPSLPDWTPETSRALLASRRPGFGEFLGAGVQEGWWNTTPGAIGAAGSLVRGEREDDTPIPQAEWSASPYYREGVPWDERMTVGRARAAATIFDENRYRRSLMAARDPGVFETVVGFGAMLLGAVPDPVNFIPVAGPAARGLRTLGAAAEGAAAGRAAMVAARALERPGVGASAMRGSVDAVAGNLLAAPLVYGVQAQVGDDVTFSRIVTDLALGAVIGAGFGTAAGLLQRVGRPSANAAVRALDAAASDIARTGEVRTPAPEMTARVIEEATMRDMPPEVRALLPEGARLSDLPTRADGAPLTREEFDARLADPEAFRTVDLLRTLDPSEEPPVPEGMVRLYHGSKTHGRYDGPAWFSSSRTYAENYRGPNAELQYLDVPRAWADAKQDPDGIGQGVSQGFTLNVEIKGDQFGLRRSLQVPRNRDARRAAAYDWYVQAVQAKQQTQRLSSLPPTTTPPVAQAAPQPRAQGAEGQTTRAMDSADTDTTAARQQVEAMRAEGQITAGDEAVIKAGDEAAQELEAAAKGLEEAAACLMRRAA